MTGHQQQPATVTEQQLVILDCLAQGMTWAEIARYMRKSPHMVKDWGRQLYVTLGASSAAQAVGLAYEAGLLPRSIPDLTRLFGVIRQRLLDTHTSPQKDTSS